MSSSSSKAVKFPSYDELETVMAEDKGNIYPAQIVKKVTKDGTADTTMYFIHYKGWGRKYDAWVQPNQICKKGVLDAELRLQQFSEAKTPKVKGPKKEQSIAQNEGKGGEEDNDGQAPTLKRKSNAELEEEARELKTHRVMMSSQDLLEEGDTEVTAAQKIDIPMVLKKHLVDEWSLISQQDPHRLLRLPRQLTVETVINEFYVSCEQGGKMTGEQLAAYKDFFQGLMLFFDKALPTVLLYRWERDQYTAAVEQLTDCTPSGIYGVEHLLRLFVRLPKFLVGVFQSHSEVSQIGVKIAQFLK